MSIKTSVLAGDGRLARLGRMVAMLRLRPFDTSTEEGRAQERFRRAALTSFSTLVARGLAMATSLVTVPLTVGYLGDERYGLWLTISSVVSMLGIADFGLGNGLLNAVANANGRDDREAARRAVSSGFFMLSGVASVVLLALVVGYSLVPWPRVFNVTGVLAGREAGPTAAVLIGCFALSMPLTTVQRVQSGYQEGFATNLWQIIAQVLGLIGLLIAIRLRAGLPWLVALMTGTGLLVTLVNFVVEFGWSRPWLRPSPRAWSWEAARGLLRTGGMFFILQVTVALAYASDNIVAAQVLRATAVPDYAMPMKLFSLAGIFPTLLFAGLWPAYGEAIARGDIAWIERTLKRTLSTTLVVVGVPAVGLVLFGREILHLWVGDAVRPGFALMAGMGAWCVLSALGNTVAVFLNGANELRAQVLCSLAMAPTAIVLKIVLARMWGLPGIVWAIVFSYVVCTALPLAWLVPHRMRELRRAHRSSPEALGTMAVSRAMEQG